MSFQELFERIGPLVSARMLYDRMDRSQGTAFVTYQDPRDARNAIREYDGANASGQPIRLTLLPAGPAEGRNNGPAASKGSLFERVERPSRSLFERIESAPRRGGRQDRSFSPEKDNRHLRVPDNIDRYVPGQSRDSRSPIDGRRGGGGRERGGRRPGARREESGRGGGRGGRREDTGRAAGPRGKKTAEQLDAEMDDYFGGNGSAAAYGVAAQTESVQNGGGAAPAVARDDDIDMIE
jgi:THO complex subunit 4